MAVATGAIVANLYYLQPLLHQVEASFKISSAGASALITATQLGYALGLAFVLPLGDLIPRRRLVVAIFVVAAVAMALGAWVASFAVFAVITLFVGLFSVGGQVMIPFAADLASEERRGRTVARLMTGLLLGILLSRTVSGFIAQLAGWRAVYVMGAILMALSALVLIKALPSEPARPHLAYPRLVASAFRLLVDLPELRRRAWLGATAFAGFSVLWTTLAFKLSAAPFGYSQATIGLFGLVGAGGVLAANAAGRLADENRQRLSTILGAVLLTGSFIIMGLGGGSIIAITAGILILDIAVQGIQITNQSIIYALAPASRSRVNSAYMVCYFLGGASGSILGGLAYQHGGWRASSTLGVVLGVMALAPALVWSEPHTAPAGAA
jgi:predicted MFS family arabinose efflux permease